MQTFYQFTKASITLEQLTRQVAALGIDIVELGRNKILAQACLEGLTMMKHKGYRMPQKFRVYPMGRNAGVYSQSNDCIFINPTLKSLKGSPPFHVSNHPYTFLIHEFGHMLHSDKVGQRYDNIKNHWFTNELRDSIKAEVGTYAGTNALEFVAEMFAGLFSGKTYSAPIMTQYKLLDGPTIL